MGVVRQITDRLTNALTGQGTRHDARMASAYQFAPLTQHDIAAAYAGSGLLRKICQIPALDMVREWRTWNGLEADQVAKVYEAEKKFGIVGKVRQAEVLRAMGGGALILGLPGDTAQPAAPTAKLAFVHVVSRWHLSFDTLQDDPTQDGYGEPAMWKMSTTAGEKTIHPSRVIPFRADQTAALAMPAWNSQDQFWGESVVAQVLDAVKDSDTARAAFASLLHKAKLLRIGIPNLIELAAEPEGEAQVMKRLSILATAESIHNATVFDAGDPETGKGGETVTDAEYNFAGAKDMLYAFGEFVAAISDIPATRLLGRAPEGMNASGDSQQRDWNKRIKAMQTLDLGPCIERLDPHLLAAANAPAGVANYSWDPLDTPSESENATRFKTQMEAIDKLQTTAAIPDEAFNRGVQSLMVEEGYLPELELALSEMDETERYGIGLPDGPANGEGGDPLSAGVGGLGGSEPARRAANDAAPRPLYVRRDLLNGEDLVKWAKANGFDKTLTADDMHVTVLYSKTPVDPLKMGESWSSDEDGGLTIRAGGPRALERFNEGAVVLQFASSSLSYRHEDMVRNGASHDWPEYLPHVTISYEGPKELPAVPYQGELRFGPEIFEDLDEDWKSKVEEQ